MPTLIRWKDGAAREAIDEFTAVDGAPPIPPGDVIVSMSRFQADGERLLGEGRRVGVRVGAGEAVEALAYDLPRISVVALEFPKFRDGRAFSWARMLRTRLGFTGEIRAVGDFLYDQVNYQHRVGFDAWEVPDGFTIEQFRRALSEMTNVYQPSTDGKKTIRELRAGG